MNEGKRFTLWHRITGAVVLLLALLTYWLTTEPTASYWDCPEYIATAYSLAPGHPPGNPTWMIAVHMAAMLPGHAAWWVNLTSGLFTALAALFLYLSAVILLRPILKNTVQLLGVSAVGALVFAWCDSAWFSAVEAEIYAMSIFFTALAVWLMLVWSDKRKEDRSADRYLILVAYITGLSIGVHQLNLLCLPACALIYLFHRNSYTSKWRITAYLIGSFALIALLLFGMMPGMVEWAAQWDLFFANRLHLPLFCGSLCYAALTLGVGIACVWTVWKHGDSFAGKLLFSLLVALSGLFALGGNLWIGGAGAVMVFLLLLPRAPGERRMNVAAWSLLLVMIGYSTYAGLMIRAGANPPLNTGHPADAFSFSSYLGRDQYGSAPLLYGRTPESQRLKREKITGSPEDGTLKAEYWSLYKTVKGEKIRPDYASGKYMVADTLYDYMLTPELNMVFPRIWSDNGDDRSGYADWVGMDTTNMARVEVSEAVDSTGKAVGRFDTSTGERHKATAHRPTYLQNLQYFGAYQLGYMYLRYLMWNFAGRQNDVYSQGQADAGNFITGIDPVDNLMLQADQDLLPDDYHKGNKGRNVYFLLPFLFGVLGIYWLTSSGRPGRRAFAVFFSLFIMTGLAIVIYLNQTPGEPRERDYAFIGSFYAYSFFVGCGSAWLAQLLQKRMNPTKAGIIGVAAGLAIAGWMWLENLDDHDRSGRTVTSDLAYNQLMTVEKDGILLVDGDNYTFPLWYAQEVEGVRRDVRIVNLAYATTDWYIPQLAIPAYEGKGIPLSAPLKVYSSRDYEIPSLPRGERTPMDAVDALKQLGNGDKAQLPSMVLRIAPAPGRRDSILVDLAAALPAGRSFIRRSELLLLDIFATQAAQGWNRPVYWQEAVATRPSLNLLALQQPVGELRKLTGDSAAARKSDLVRSKSLYMNAFRYGNLGDKNVYADYIVRLMASSSRRRMARYATEMWEAGDTASALAMLQKMEREFDPSVIPYNTRGIPFIYFNEGIEAGRIYALAGKARGDREMQAHGMRLLEEAMARSGKMRDYREALPQDMRNAITNEMLIGARTWMYPVETYLEAGGDMNSDAVKRVVGKRDLRAELDKWQKDKSLRYLLTNARAYTAGVLTTEEKGRFMENMHIFMEKGGTREELEGYAEFGGFTAWP